MRRLRESQKEELRRSLMDAGLKLIHTQGFQKATIESITSAVGVSKGTFYTYFESKEDLVFAALRRMQAEQEDDVKEQLDRFPDIRARVCEYFKGLSAWSQEHAEIAWIWHWERFRRAGPDENRPSPMRSQLIRALEEAQESGEMDEEPNAELISVDLQGIFFIHYVRWYHGQSEGALVDTVIPAIDRYLHGVLTGA